MAYQVVYSSNVQEEIREILIYLLEEWTFEVSENFSDYLISTIDMLSQQPYAGRRHDLISSVREFRVKPHYLVYYSVLEEQQLIHVLNIVDSRRKR
jgi:plasmid stabilization system protein ParE